MSRSVICVVVGTILVVLAVTAAVLFLPAPPSFSATFDVAELLPGDTQVYLKLSNVSKLFAKLEEGAPDEGRAGGTTRPGEVGHVHTGEDAARKIRSLHVSFHGVRAHQDGEHIGLLAIAELEGPTPLDELLPPSLMTQLQPGGEHAGIQVQKLDILPLRAALGVSFSIAQTEARVILSTDRTLLEGVLDALQDGRDDSLADQKDFRAMRTGQLPGDVELYVALPVLLRSFKNAMPKDAHGQLPRALLLDLAGIKYLSFTTGYAFAKGAVRLLMSLDSPVFRLLAQPDTDKSIPRYLPRSTVAFLTASVGNGQDTWRGATALAADVLMKTGQIPNKAAYDRKIREAEKAFNVSFDQAASLVKEAGVFLDGEFGMGALCLCAKVRDPMKAEELMNQVIASDGFKKARRAKNSTSYARLGATIYVSDDDLVWSVVDECLFIARRRETIEKVIAARGEVKALSDLAAYRQTNALLPGQNSWLGFVRTGQLVESAFPAAGEEFRDWFHSACVTAYAGVVEVQWRQSKEVDLRQFIGEALFGFLGQIRQTGDAGLKLNR